MSQNQTPAPTLPPTPPVAPAPTAATPTEVNVGTTTPVQELVAAIRGEVKKAVVGQDDVIGQFLIALLVGGHVLLEGVPGVAKTLTAKSLAQSINAEFKRIQFTPDLMPSDVVGTNVFNVKTQDFTLKEGPVFTDILLADEINRTPPKTQASLLEAMQERRVTIDGIGRPLSPLFIVFATQNPLDYEGTYPLPEAQVDRFLIKVLMDYPLPEQEMQLLDRVHRGFDAHELSTVGLKGVTSVDAIMRARGGAESHCQRRHGALHLSNYRAHAQHGEPDFGRLAARGHRFARMFQSAGGDERARLHYSRRCKGDGAAGFAPSFAVASRKRNGRIARR